MLEAVFPGSFDPPTNGHLNLIERSAHIFDILHVVISVNTQKVNTFTPEERFSMLSELLKPYSNVKLHIWDRLTVDFCEEHQVKVIVRGVRPISDFGYEFELAMTNKGLNPGIEVLFMPTDPKYLVLRASAIREIVQLGGDITAMVPPLVAEALRKRFNVSG